MIANQHAIFSVSALALLALSQLGFIKNNKKKISTDKSRHYFLKEPAKFGS
jgi:hypothetical protein